MVELAIPALRNRPEDLRGLADTILVRVAGQMRRAITGYAPDALEQILRYPWPGNIRELENAIERACALATGDTVELMGLAKGPNTIPCGLFARMFATTQREWAFQFSRDRRHERRRRSLERWAERRECLSLVKESR